MSASDRPADALQAPRRLPSVGHGVRVIARSGRVERGHKVAGVFVVSAAELRVEPDRTGRSVAVHGAWLQVAGVGWCPVHRDAHGVYVRAHEGTPDLPPLDLFAPLGGRPDARA